MQKKKVFDIAGSNIELLGSKVEKKCREAAGKKEKCWSKAGKKVGLEIWRIEQFKVKKWPTLRFGEFFDGDSYIILNTYKKKPDESDALSWDLHFWLGSDTTQDEAGTAAYKTVELDDALGGAPVQHREVMGREGPLFLSYFKQYGGIKLLSGGAESGFNHVEPESYQPRLLHLKGRKNIRVTQVEMSASSLSAGDTYILDAGLMIYQWHGKNSNQKEKVRAAQYAAGLDSERKGQAEICVIDQLDKDIPAEFWEILGGICEIKEDDGGDDEWEKDTDKRMFQLTDAGGKLEFNLVGQNKTMTRKKLNGDDVFIVDVGCELYVWIGQGASETEKKTAMTKAQDYLKDYKRPAWLPITRIMEGSENELFESYLKPPKRKFKKSTGGPSVEQKGDMGCYLTESISSNGSMFLNWSESNVDGAVAYFKPTKTVPKFKFKNKGGKSELTRETDSHRINYYEGWVNYIKLAKEYKSTFMYKTSSVALLSHTGSKLEAIPRSEMIDLSTIEAVAAIPGENHVFQGVHSIDRGSFLNKAQSVGAALTLPK